MFIADLKMKWSCLYAFQREAHRTARRRIRVFILSNIRYGLPDCDIRRREEAVSGNSLNVLFPGKSGGGPVCREKEKLNGF